MSRRAWEGRRRWKEKKTLRMRDFNDEYETFVPLNREADRMEPGGFNLRLFSRKLGYPDPWPPNERKQLTRPTTWGWHSRTQVSTRLREPGSTKTMYEGASVSTER